MQHFSNVCACQLRKNLGELFSSSTKLEQKKSQSLAGAILRFDGLLISPTRTMLLRGNFSVEPHGTYRCNIWTQYGPYIAILTFLIYVHNMFHLHPLPTNLAAYFLDYVISDCLFCR